MSYIVYLLNYFLKQSQKKEWQIRKMLFPYKELLNFLCIDMQIKMPVQDANINMLRTHKN